MGTQIVQVNVSQQIAPAPSKLQQTGAFVSQGGTTVTVGTYKLLTQPSDLTSVLTPAVSITSLTWSTGVVTVVTATGHGIPVGDTVNVVVAGAVPAGYNGTFAGTYVSSTSFTYPLAANPGSETVPGTAMLAAVSEATAMSTTFFAQGSATAVYVLELGAGTPAQGVTALTTFINANAQFFYSYLVPREWASESTFLAMLASYESTTSKTYFFTTMTLSNYASFTALMKDVVGLIEAPGIPVTEFSLAAVFWVTLTYAPSTVNLVPPLAFTEVAGVTPYPTIGNSALFQTLKTAGVNIIGTGAEGGISNTIVLWGTTMDGHDFNYWYSVDWVQININLNLSNEIINGSNNPLAPLYYDQPGINRLQARAQDTMNDAIAFGLALPPVTVDAVPFYTYVQENPSDYPLGVYNGLSVTYTPRRGFTSITFNVVVTELIQA